MIFQPDQDAPIQKAASSLVVESLQEENMADLLKKSKSVFHEKEQIKNQEAKQFSTAVSGTPWHVVWTQDGNNFKLFFYNPSSKTSVWQRPSELYNRKDVDLLVLQPPMGKFMTMPNDMLSMYYLLLCMFMRYVTKNGIACLKNRKNNRVKKPTEAVP
jgi:hypothetical protein